jgi:alkylation response protein AidB-like acyl-CoA dehydrogenase
MAFLVSSDLEQFLESLEGFFAERFPSGVVHGKEIDKDGLRGDWQALAELGATAAPLPESCGGLGMGVIAAFTITQIAGRWLSPLPVRESIGTVSALMTISADLDNGRVAELAAGNVVGFMQESPAGSVWGSADLAAGNGDIGTARMELGSFLTGKVEAPLILAMSRLGVAAELSGICSRVVEMTAEYSKTRKQFGKPLASFQAVQHKLSDMLMWSEQISSLGRFAAWAVDNDRAQFIPSATAVFGYAAEFAPKLVETSIQLHGGIGFTWEYPLHLYLRRTKSLVSLFGGGDIAYSSLTI